MSGNPFDREDVAEIACTPGDTRVIHADVTNVGDENELVRDLIAIQKKHPELYIEVKIGMERVVVRIRRRRL